MVPHMSKNFDYSRFDVRTFDDLTSYKHGTRILRKL
jgi:hypothetical protein